MDEEKKTELEKTVIKQTAEDFSNEVEEKVWMEDITYYEAVVALMEQRDLEPSHVAKLMTAALKSKMALELEDINLIKKSGKGRLF